MIASGLKADTMKAIIDGENIGTRFISGKKLANAKRRLAHSDSLARGKVYINEGAVQIMNDNSATSLLPVGITQIKGDFERGDVVEIRDAKNIRIGYGICQYDSQQALKIIGKKTAKH